MTRKQFDEIKQRISFLINSIESCKTSYRKKEYERELKQKIQLLKNDTSSDKWLYIHAIEEVLDGSKYKYFN